MALIEFGIGGQFQQAQTDSEERGNLVYTK